MFNDKSLFCFRNILKRQPSDFNLEPKESKIYALNEFKHLNAFPEMYSYLLGLDGTEFNKNLIMYLETMEINDPISPAIQKLREIRDKFLGHNEDIELDTIIPYKSIEILIDHAKEVIAFFSLYYSGIHLTANGNFYLSHSALRWASKFKDFVSNDSVKKGGWRTTSLKKNFSQPFFDF